MSAAITSSSETVNIMSGNDYLTATSVQLRQHIKTLEKATPSLEKISELSAQILSMLENTHFPRHLKFEAKVISSHMAMMASTYATDSEAERKFNANGITNRISSLNFEILVSLNPYMALTEEANKEIYRNNIEIVANQQCQAANELTRKMQSNQLGYENITANLLQNNKELVRHGQRLFSNMDFLKAFFLRWTSNRSNQRMFRREIQSLGFKHLLSLNLEQFLYVASRVGGQNLSGLFCDILACKELTQKEMDRWVVALVNADANPNDRLFRNYSLASDLINTPAPISEFAIRILICGGLDVLKPTGTYGEGRSLNVSRWMQNAVEYKKLLTQKVLNVAMAHIVLPTSSMSYTPLSEIAIAPMRICYNLPILNKNIIPLVMEYIGLPERWLNQLCVDVAVADHCKILTATAAQE